MYYHEERMIKLSQIHPSLSNTALGKIISEEWKNCDSDTRNYYEQMMIIALEDYRNQHNRRKSQTNRKSRKRMTRTQQYSEQLRERAFGAVQKMRGDDQEEKDDTEESGMNRVRRKNTQRQRRKSSGIITIICTKQKKNQLVLLRKEVHTIIIR